MLGVPADFVLAIWSNGVRVLGDSLQLLQRDPHVQLPFRSSRKHERSATKGKPAWILLALTTCQTIT